MPEHSKPEHTSAIQAEILALQEEISYCDPIKKETFIRVRLEQKDKEIEALRNNDQDPHLAKLKILELQQKTLFEATADYLLHVESMLHTKNLILAKIEKLKL